MTFPSAVLTLFVLPDFPHNSKSRWLTEEERQLAIDRCARAGIAQIGGKLDVRLVKRIFGSWRIYLISITYLIVSCLLQAMPDRTDVSVRYLGPRRQLHGYLSVTLLRTLELGADDLRAGRQRCQRRAPQCLVRRYQAYRHTLLLILWLAH